MTRCVLSPLLGGTEGALDEDHVLVMTVLVLLFEPAQDSVLFTLVDDVLWVSFHDRLLGQWLEALSPLEAVIDPCDTTCQGL